MDECFTVNSKDKGLFETLLPLLRKNMSEDLIQAQYFILSPLIIVTFWKMLCEFLHVCVM